MSRECKVECDCCGRDLTYTGNCEDYYMEVHSASKAPAYTRDGGTSGAVTAMAIEPPVKTPLHFCGWGCLRKHMELTPTEND